MRRNSKACCEVMTVTDLVKISGIVRRINGAKARSELDIIVTEMMRNTFEDRELVLGALAACGQQSKERKLGHAPSREVGTPSGNRFYVYTKFQQ
jgi:hypothetical protein